MINHSFDSILHVHVKTVQRRFIFFLIVVILLGLLKFFDRTPLGSHIIVGSYTVSSAILGFLFILKYNINPRLLGFMLTSSIYAHTAIYFLLLVFYDYNKLVFYDYNKIDALVGGILWLGFGFMFTLNWYYIIEPFYRMYNRMFPDHRSSSRFKKNHRSSSRFKKSDRKCIGCK